MVVCECVWILYVNKKCERRISPFVLQRDLHLPEDNKLHHGTTVSMRVHTMAKQSFLMNKDRELQHVPASLHLKNLSTHAKKVEMVTLSAIPYILLFLLIKQTYVDKQYSCRLKDLNVLYIL